MNILIPDEAKQAQSVVEDVLGKSIELTVISTVWAGRQLAKEYAALLDYAKQGYLGNIEDRWEEKQVEFKTLTCCLRKSIEACLGI